MYKVIKKIFDYLASIVCIILLLPILSIIGLLVYVFLGRPIIFKQLRPGKNSKPFKFYKFRSMTNETDFDGNLLEDHKRLTSIGRFLRKTSLDELPSIYNIVKGDMSFVGPRPLLMEYLPRYSKEQISRQNVKPGITGLAQVKGRNSISWDEKFKFDIFYIKNISFWLDIKIILLTIWIVLKREGINHKERVGMERFIGNEKK
tara:strand:+ start:130 stop:738 length:609 start_codon:yes stop_codon:yes gene_type:complete